MDQVGNDVHKRESQVCILTPSGEVEEVRIATTRERFREVLGGRARARVLIETSTESEWVARCLEELGHELIVADPGFAPMYRMRTRRVKRDLRDARALAEACRSGTCRLAHRRSEGQRRVTTKLVPRKKGSGEKQHRGRITRAGDSRTRHLLVQASQRIRYSRVPETLGLRMWAKRIESRRGKAVATVALARELAGVLFAMLRDIKRRRHGRHTRARMEGRPNSRRPTGSETKKGPIDTGAPLHRKSFKRVPASDNEHHGNTGHHWFNFRSGYEGRRRPVVPLEHAGAADERPWTAGVEPPRRPRRPGGTNHSGRSTPGDRSDRTARPGRLAPASPSSRRPAHP